MYIYGGYDIKEGDRGNLYFVNLEEDEPRWVRPTLKGDVPTGLSRHSAVVYDKRLYVLGGESSSSQSRAFFYIDLGTFQAGKPRYSPSSGEIPLEIDSHTAVVHATSANKEEHFMLVFGGYYKSKKSNVVFQYSFSRNVWTRLTESSEKPDQEPVPRTDHTAVMYNGSMYVFGGADDENNKLNDLW